VSEPSKEGVEGGDALPPKATLEASLARFFEPEVRELKCEKCSEGTHARQTLRISSMPKYLLLHLKRFIVVEQPIPSTDENCPQGSNGRSPQVEYVFQKNKAPVAIVKSLSLDAFRKEDVESKDIDPSTETSRYAIKSIVYHHGFRASSGHYTADALRKKADDGGSKNNDDDKMEDKEKAEKFEWVTFDDSNSGVTSFETIASRKVKQSNAYMMLYAMEDNELTKDEI